jgi:myo-inositol-1(or 4)-monophosphatase
MSLPSDPRLDVALHAARAGGEVLRKYFRGEFFVRVKDGPDFVSQADLEAERAVIEVIRRTFPDHNILAEESQRDAVDSKQLWIIDPLDGTTNFIHGVPQISVSIAYYEAGQPILGVVYNPINHDCYFALRGHGAWLNEKPTKVSPEPRMDLSLIGTGFYYDRGPLMEGTLKAVGDVFRNGVHCIRRMGSAALDLCMVASGQYGAYFEYLLSPWDFAAGRLIVEEAGGKVTTCTGDPLPLARTHILASNGLLHDELQRLVSPHLPPQ